MDGPLIKKYLQFSFFKYPCFEGGFIKVFIDKKIGKNRISLYCSSCNSALKSRYLNRKMRNTNLYFWGKNGFLGLSALVILVLEKGVYPGLLS